MSDAVLPLSRYNTTSCHRFCCTTRTTLLARTIHHASRLHHAHYEPRLPRSSSEGVVRLCKGPGGMFGQKAGRWSGAGSDR